MTKLRPLTTIEGIRKFLNPDLYKEDINIMEFEYTYQTPFYECFLSKKDVLI